MSRSARRPVARRGAQAAHPEGRGAHGTEAEQHPTPGPVTWLNLSIHPVSLSVDDVDLARIWVSTARRRTSI